MNIYKTSKEIKEDGVMKKKGKRIPGKEELSDNSKNDQRDYKRIKSD